MATPTLLPYKRAPRPSDPASVTQYTDNEYRKLEQVIAALNTAVVALQQSNNNSGTSSGTKSTS